MREKSKHQFIFVIVIFGMYNFNGLNIPKFRKEKLFIRILNRKIRRHAPRPIFWLNVWPAREKHVARMWDTMWHLQTKKT